MVNYAHVGLEYSDYYYYYVWFPKVGWLAEPARVLLGAVILRARRYVVRVLVCRHVDPMVCKETLGEQIDFHRYLSYISLDVSQLYGTVRVEVHIFSFHFQAEHYGLNDTVI